MHICNILYIRAGSIIIREGRKDVLEVKAQVALLILVFLVNSSFISSSMLISHMNIVLDGVTTVQVDPLLSNPTVGENFTVDITVINVDNLTSWEFKLYYLNNLVTCTEVIEGPFLKSVGGTYRVFDVTNDYNGTHGRVLAACTLLGPYSVSGNGTLAMVTFQADALGGTLIDLEDTKLGDENIPPHPIAHTVVDGTAIITPLVEQVLDVFTQKGGIGVNETSDAFSPGEIVRFYALLKYQGTPVPGIVVQFTMYDPLGAVTVKTSVTDEFGYATSNVTLSSTPVFGNYLTIAAASTHGQNYSDTVTFKVGWIVCILEAATYDRSGNPETIFVREALVYVNVSLESISITQKQLLVLLEVADEFGRRVAHEWIRFMIPPGNTDLTIGFRIPPWSINGDAEVFVGAFTNIPWLGGTPYCPGEYIVFNIGGV